MREGAVGFSHLVRVFTLLDSRATIVCCVEQLARETVDHRGLVPLARRADQPANGQCLATLRTNIDGNLIGCTTNAARTDFHVWSHVVERLMEHRDGLLLRLGLNLIKGTVDD